MTQAQFVGVVTGVPHVKNFGETAIQESFSEDTMTLGGKCMRIAAKRSFGMTPTAYSIASHFLYSTSRSTESI